MYHLIKFICFLDDNFLVLTAECKLVAEQLLVMPCGWTIGLTNLCLDFINNILPDRNHIVKIQHSDQLAIRIQDAVEVHTVFHGPVFILWRT